MPTQRDDRGGGFAPAHRRNLDPAHSDNRTLSKVIAAAPQPNASGGGYVGSRPSMPTQRDDRGGGFAPAHRRNLDPAQSDNQTLSKVIAAAPQPNASGGGYVGSRPSMPTQKGEVGVDRHLRKATTLALRLAITITNHT